MHWSDKPCTTQLSKTRGRDSALDSESLVAEELSRFNLAKFFSFALEDKESFGQSFQTLLSESDRELATLLREVRTSPETGLEEARRRIHPGGDLLMRAIRCAVMQHVLQVELSGLALADELTGLYNRRAFFCLAERQLKLASRSGSQILLFFIDVNGLKCINDTFGHSEGDLALIRTSKALTETFRNSDVVARLGGDEFAALAIEAPEHGEAIITDRLCERLELANVHEPRYRLSVSVGSTWFVPGIADSVAELIIQADQAMYRAKGSQRMSMEQLGVNGCPKEFSAYPIPFR